LLDDEIDIGDRIRESVGSKLFVRWFPTPLLPKTNGRVEWAGMGGHFYASAFFIVLLAQGAGAVGMAVWAFGVVLPKRLRRRALGGATPLGHGVGGGAGGST
jgi:hypothetical protein